MPNGGKEVQQMNNNLQNKEKLNQKVKGDKGVNLLYKP